MELFLGGTDVGLLVLRVFVGVILIGHGFPKLFRSATRTQTIQYMKSVGVHPILSWAAAAIEVFAGLGLVMGFLTPVAAAFVAAEMAGTTVLSQRKLGKKLMSGYELDLAFLVAAVTIALAGPGAFSVDAAMGVTIPGAWVAVAAGISLLVLLGAVVLRSMAKRAPSDPAKAQP